MESKASSNLTAPTHHSQDMPIQPEKSTPSSEESCPTNQTMFQAFEWYSPSDNQHWKRLASTVPDLAALGITSMWIPPATKTAWRDSNGYDAYDLYDLGEFHQKGARSTKWGNKEELVEFVEIANANGVKVIFDAVLNHKAGADYVESVKVSRVDPEDRNKVISKPEKIEAWTGFDFKGRHGQYSSMKWNKAHFTGTDYDHKSKKNAVWLFDGKEWAHDVDEELGNYDYLMFADIDHTHPDVRKDLLNWVQWLSSQVKLGGLRLDAIKHYSASFLRDFLLHIDRNVDRNWFIVGEYWRDESHVLARYIEYMDHRISLFDVKLLSNFSRLSMMENADLRTVLDGTLVELKPKNAVTFVANHDTQAGRSFEAPIAPYFVPIAYAIILLHCSSVHPCVFYADLYGSSGPSLHLSTPLTSGGLILPRLIVVRDLYAYGPQLSYFDTPSCIGFTRQGHKSKTGGAGLAVIMSNSWEVGEKRMNVGKQHAGEVWTDVLKRCWGEVVIDEEGWGDFGVGPRSVSVWVDKGAVGRQRVDGLVFACNFFKSSRAKSKKEQSSEMEPEKLRRKKSYPDWLRPR